MLKTRLDALLVQRGLYGSRTRAAAAVMAGEVRVGEGGTRTAKPGDRVSTDVAVEIDPRRDYVSRGGVKLANALDALELDVSARRCLDAGSSTGGFTDCLLKRDAAHVTAVDVAYGQLDWRLRGDDRVTVIERTNARALRPELLPYRPDLIVADVSFISLTKVLPAVLACADDRFDCLALVKPQFEVGRSRVGGGGVVRSSDDRRSALVAVGSHVIELGYTVLGFQPSGLPGPAGNRETFVWIAPRGDRRSIGDVHAAAWHAEP